MSKECPIVQNTMSKEQVIPKLIPVFRTHGYEGTSLAMLSKATGLGKASLYHYFPQGKKGMAEAVMNYIALSFEEIVLQPLTGLGTPEARIVRMCEALNDFYDRGKNNCFLAIMSIGEADKLFYERVRQRLEIWIEAIANILIEAGFKPETARRRSQAAIIEIQGALVLVRILQQPEIFLRTLNDLPLKLMAED